MRADETGKGKLDLPADTATRMAVLLQRVGRQRDREAFALLFRHFAPRLKSYLIRQGSSTEAAEELIQDIMLLVWRKAEQYDPKRAAASTWIYTIARNRRIDVLRRERRPEPEPEDPMAGPVVEATGDAVIAFKQNRKRLMQAMTELSEEQALVVKMSFMEDKSHSMIARELDLPLGTVKSRLRLAFKRLREVLGEGW